jgi:phosphopantothenoylcysteine synthetase/decarboxylase
MAVSDFRVKERIEGKISSEIEEFTLTFVKVPKIIGMFRELAPKAILVGFKLVSGLGEDELVNAGHDLLLKYDCNYVLANDAARIDPAGHKGWLIQRDKGFKIFTGKEAIANGIKEGVEKIWKI